MSSRTVSEATQQKVDAEIRRILDERYVVSRNLLEANRDKVEKMAALLLEHETLDAQQIDNVMKGIENFPPVDPAASGEVAPEPAPAV